MVVVEQATESFASNDPAVRVRRLRHLDQSIFETLAIPLPMVVRYELRDGEYDMGDPTMSSRVRRRPSRSVAPPAAEKDRTSTQHKPKRDRLRLRRIGSRASKARLIAVALLVMVVPGCATLRLNGCSKAAECSELSVYTCGDDFVCVDSRGEILRSEPVAAHAGGRSLCRICAIE